MSSELYTSLMREYVLQELLKHGPVVDITDGGWSSSGTPEQLKAQMEAYDKLDKSPAALLAYKRQTDVSKAVQALLTDDGYLVVGIRATFVALWTELNNLRKLHSLPRLNETEIAQLIGQTLMKGGGNPREVS